MILSKWDQLRRFKRSAQLSEVTQVQSVAETTLLMGHDLKGPCQARSCSVCGIKPAGVRPYEWRHMMSEPVKRAERLFAGRDS